MYNKVYKMWRCGTVSVLLLLLTGVLVLNGQEQTTTAIMTTTKETVDFDPKHAYCFEFTWLGPNYDNTVGFKMTCEDYLSENRIVEHGVCRQPFVITNDSTRPAMDYIWEKFKTRVVRRKRNGEVCAKFTYLFNGEITNITYMRTKVFAENEGAVTSGCYTQTNGGTESELCVCVPRVGDYRPCNHAAVVRWQSISSLLIGTLAFMLTWLPI